MQRRTLVVRVEVTGTQLDYRVTGEVIGRKLVAVDPAVTEYGLRFIAAEWDGPRGDAPTDESKAPRSDEGLDEGRFTII